MSEIKGPWAFVYLQNVKQKLWFGRDFFGRRSLLWKKCDCFNDSGCFTISSVVERATADAWEEISANGIYSLNVETVLTDSLSFNHHPWYPQPFNINFHPNHLLNDCSVVTNSESLTETNELQKESNFFVTSGKACEMNSILQFNLNLPEPSDLKLYNGITDELFVPENMKLIVQEFEANLTRAVELRIKNIPTLCRMCEENGSVTNATFDNVTCSDSSQKTSCRHCRVAILFSGGIDSCVLAALADRHVPLDLPIDLLNVAFEQKKTATRSRTSKNEKQNKKLENDVASDTYRTPDRETGLEALVELQNLSPERQWNFVEINVTLDVLQQNRDLHIRNLLQPLNTVLDDSIGSALWFAARGIGKILNSTEMYCCPAKVLLVGMGADEQMAGYSRHRVKYKNESWKGLAEELCSEMRRISYRNLGRDDRIISDHGREPRFPFLDEDIVSFLNKLPLWYKTNLDLPRGIGEKILLRLLAHSIGLKTTAVRPKRAIQFGSRIAKAENKSEKGSDVCSR